MATLTSYSFAAVMDIPSLVIQIQASSIVTVLDHIEVTEPNTYIWFKDALSIEDQTALTTVVENYIYIAPPIVPPNEVVTQFEKRDKTIKLAHGEVAVDENGEAVFLLKIPGTPGSADGRWISSGSAFFDIHTPGDRVTGVWFVDHDNMLGYGVDFVVGSYTDDEVDTINKGWIIPPPGFVKAEAIGGYGFAPAGFYIMVAGKKGSGVTSGTFYCNFEWGKTE